jgi:hypothetical protein
LVSHPDWRSGPPETGFADGGQLMVPSRKGLTMPEPFATLTSTREERLRKRVFISFRQEDRIQVKGLLLLTENPRFDIEFYDKDIRTPYDSTDPICIRRNIKDKISRTNVTTYLLSTFTYMNAWVNFEIKESIEKGNEIICMGLPGVRDVIRPPVEARRLGLTWHLWDVDKLHRLIALAP